MKKSAKAEAFDQIVLLLSASGKIGQDGQEGAPSIVQSMLIENHAVSNSQSITCSLALGKIGSMLSVHYGGHESYTTPDAVLYGVTSMLTDKKQLTDNWQKVGQLAMSCGDHTEALKQLLSADNVYNAVNRLVITYKHAVECEDVLEGLGESFTGSLLSKVKKAAHEVRVLQSLDKTVNKVREELLKAGFEDRDLVSLANTVVHYYLTNKRELSAALDEQKQFLRNAEEALDGFGSGNLIQRIEKALSELRTVSHRAGDLSLKLEEAEKTIGQMNARPARWSYGLTGENPDTHNAEARLNRINEYLKPFKFADTCGPVTRVKELVRRHSAVVQDLDQIGLILANVGFTANRPTDALNMLVGDWNASKMKRTFMPYFESVSGAGVWSMQAVLNQDELTRIDKILSGYGSAADTMSEKVLALANSLHDGSVAFNRQVEQNAKLIAEAKTVNGLISQIYTNDLKPVAQAEGALNRYMSAIRELGLVKQDLSTVNHERGEVFGILCNLSGGNNSIDQARLVLRKYEELVKNYQKLLAQSEKVHLILKPIFYNSSPTVQAAGIVKRWEGMVAQEQETLALLRGVVPVEASLVSTARIASGSITALSKEVNELVAFKEEALKRGKQLQEAIKLTGESNPDIHSVLLDLIRNSKKVVNREPEYKICSGVMVSVDRVAFVAAVVSDVRFDSLGNPVYWVEGAPMKSYQEKFVFPMPEFKVGQEVEVLFGRNWEGTTIVSFAWSDCSAAWVYTVSYKNPETYGKDSLRTIAKYKLDSSVLVTTDRTNGPQKVSYLYWHKKNRSWYYQVGPHQYAERLLEAYVAPMFKLGDVIRPKKVFVALMKPEVSIALAYFREAGKTITLTWEGEDLLNPEPIIVFDWLGDMYDSPEANWEKVDSPKLPTFTFDIPGLTADQLAEMTKINPFPRFFYAEEPKFDFPKGEQIASGLIDWTPKPNKATDTPFLDRVLSDMNAKGWIGKEVVVSVGAGKQAKKDGMNNRGWVERLTNREGGKFTIKDAFSDREGLYFILGDFTLHSKYTDAKV